MGALERGGDVAGQFGEEVCDGDSTRGHVTGIIVTGIIVWFVGQRISCALPRRGGWRRLRRSGKPLIVPVRLAGAVLARSGVVAVTHVRIRPPTPTTVPCPGSGRREARRCVASKVP
ncbi:hypothetical protein MTOK_24580 [Mycolicibacterium tokaiense]|nr:hypothetical protein MTOK_24580 [Mycolicibacterium tokaiense]